MDGNQLRKAHKRQQILQTAQRLFLEQGYTEVSVKQIAKRASASQVTLYKYFPSKIALGRAVVLSMIETGYTYYQQIIDNQTATFMEKVQQMMTESVAESEALAPSFFHFLVSEMRGDNDDQTVQTAYETQKQHFWHTLMEQGRSQGVVNPEITDRAAMTYVDMYVSYIQKPKDATKSQKNFDALHADGEILTQMFFYGLLGKPTKDKV